jgi:tetratricopeptide (TPR) repeat protein
MNLWAKADVAAEEGDFIEAELITREALVWARMADQPRMTARLLENRVLNELMASKPNYKQILTDLDAADELHDQYEGNKAATVKTRALVLAKQGEREKALEQLELARALANPEYSVEYARFSFTAVEIYTELGLSAEAEKEAEKCIKALEKSGASRTTAIIYRNLAEIFKNRGDKDRAIEFLLKATSMFGLDSRLPNQTAPSIIGNKK